MLYTPTEEKGSYRKSYVHVIINGGDPAIWPYMTVRIRGRNRNLARARAANTANNKHRVKNKERLGPCSVTNLGPRIPKCKLVKLKRN